jgi:ribosomal protein L5
MQNELSNNFQTEERMTIPSVRLQDSDMRAMGPRIRALGRCRERRVRATVSGDQPGHYTGGIHSQLLLRLVDADSEVISPSAFLPAASVSI